MEQINWFTASLRLLIVTITSKEETSWLKDETLRSEKRRSRRRTRRSSVPARDRTAFHPSVDAGGSSGVHRAHGRSGSDEVRARRFAVQRGGSRRMVFAPRAADARARCLHGRVDREIERK